MRRSRRRCRGCSCCGLSEVEGPTDLVEAGAVDAVEVGEGPCEPEHPVVTPHREGSALERAVKRGGGARCRCSVVTQPAAWGVRVQLPRVPGQPMLGPRSRPPHPPPPPPPPPLTPPPT